MQIGLLPEACIHVRFGPRTPGGVRGYEKSAAPEQFIHSKIHIYLLRYL